MVEAKDYRHPDARKPSELAETIVNKVPSTLAAHQPRVDLADLKQKLKSKLRAIDAHPEIVSMTKPLGLGWVVSNP